MYEKISEEMKTWLIQYENNIYNIQEQFILDLMVRLKDTAIGKEKGYKDIKTVEDFQNKTFIQHYRDLNPYINRIIAGETNVIYPESPSNWIQTSGTTGEIKMFPYNQEFIDNFFQAFSLANKLFIYRYGKKGLNIFSGQTCLISATGNCGTLGTGINKKPLSFLTGWFASQVPTIAPPLNIQLIPDWEEKILKTAVYYLQKNLTRLTGVTSYIIMFLQKIESGFDKNLFSILHQENPQRCKELEEMYEKHNELIISEVWKNLILLNCSGVDPYKYKDLLLNLVPKGIIFQSFMGSEGFYGFQSELNSPEMFLLPNNAFYEFLDVEEYHDWQLGEGNSPNRHTVANLKSGREYVFCVSNYLGFTSYVTGDIIKVVSLKPLLFLYSRRLNREINLAAEKMNENHIISSFNRVQKKTPFLYRDYLCIAVNQPYPHYVFVIESIDNSLPNLDQLATDIETGICLNNIMYKEIRLMNVIDPLRIVNLYPGELDRYMLNKVKMGEWNYGQQKLPYLVENQEILNFCKIKDKGISKY